MKTNELIDMLARQVDPVAPTVPMRWLLGQALPAFSLSLLGVLVGLGAIPLSLLAEPGVWMKFAYGLGLTATAFPLALRLGQPGAPWAERARMPMGVVLVVVAVGGVNWWIQAPGLASEAVLWGHSWLQCPLNILMVSLPLLVAAVCLLRHLAPTRPGLAGGMAGLCAGGLGATLYGLACTETSPTFVALWYTAGILLSGLAGAMLGRVVLRW